MSLAAASYSHLMDVHSGGAKARPVDAYSSLWQSILQSRHQSHVCSTTETMMTLPYPAPANPQSSSAETGGLEETLWNACEHLWHGVPCYLQSHED